MKDHNPLSKWQELISQKAKNLEPADPPSPWKRIEPLYAAGVLSGGWTYGDKFVLISSDGYSIYSLKNESIIAFEKIGKQIYDYYLDGDLRFKVANLGETINVFGITAGDGIKKSGSDWYSDIIYPHWPEETPVLFRGEMTDWETTYAIRLNNLSGWLRCGFSYSGRYLAVIGHAGAEFFLREDM